MYKGMCVVMLALIAVGAENMQLRKSRTLTVSIDCPAERVYAFVSNPENLPNWILFIRSARKIGRKWVVETTDGPMGFQFVPANRLGVLDHVVTPAAGNAILNSMRVTPNGRGSEVIFTLFQQPEMSDQKFLDDAALEERDLRSLKSLLEK